MGYVVYKCSYSFFYETQIQIKNIIFFYAMHLCECKLDAFQFMGDVAYMYSYAQIQIRIE